jgi:hypothetical protein
MTELLQQIATDMSFLMTSAVDPNIESITYTPSVTTLATATASIGGGAVTGLAVVVAGSGYTAAPTVSLVGGGGAGANITAAITNGAVSGFTVVAGGTGYTTAPTVVLTGGTTPLTRSAHVKRARLNRLEEARQGVATWLEVDLANDATAGITTVNRGGDTVTVSPVYGGSTKVYVVAESMEQNAAHWRLRLR